jgi:hypothetical protein
MRRAKIVFVAAMTIPLAGCLLSGKPKTVAYSPPPPKPAPAPPPEPLSIPQTHVDLPPSQPWNPDAVKTEQPPEPPPPVQPKPAAAAVKTPRAPAPKPAEPPAAPDPEAAPERPPIQEILSTEERTRLQDSVQKHQAEIRALVLQAQQGGHHLTANQKETLGKIEQFMKQSEQAEKTGDIRSADEFAEKANILATELQSGK